MDHARSTIQNLFRGEPRTYTRFSLAQQMDGDHSQVEMKLGNPEMEEEMGNSFGDTTTTRIKPRSNPRSTCFMITGTLLVFLIGFLIGYLAFRGKVDITNNICSYGTTLPSCQTIPSDSEDIPEAINNDVAQVLSLAELKDQFTTKLTNSNYSDRIQKIAVDGHEAGSDRDDQIARFITGEFKSYGLDIWNNEQYVTLQQSGSDNKVTILENGVPADSYTTARYLAYSASGSVTGKLVYANYGKKDDFNELKRRNIAVNGTVVLVRDGKISLAEKVAFAESENAVAVLIYRDQKDYPNLNKGDDFFGHVHFGSGDPFTPGFPSFNHTQFPPAKSSGLPGIQAQSISANFAQTLLNKMNGEHAPSDWEGSFTSYKLTGDDSLKVKVEVNNVFLEKKLYSVFGVIKGLVDPERYVVVGAQRDSFGPGATKSAVGTALLLELSRALSSLVKDGYKPKRSIVFASWSGGDYGHVGATEWLEGFMSMLHLKAFAYINLDSTVLGSKKFKASASPMMYSLLKTVLKEVKFPGELSVYQKYAESDDWESQILVPMSMDDASYPFLAYSGIPSISFSFTEKDDRSYDFFGTQLDTLSRLISTLNEDEKLRPLLDSAMNVAGRMVLKLTHDNLISLDCERYSKVVSAFVVRFNRYIREVKAANLSSQWLFSANGDYKRAVGSLKKDIINSDLNENNMAKAINDRIMRVEHQFLSPYVSAKDAPFRHIFIGKGGHTIQALLDNLDLLKKNKDAVNVDVMKNQLALATWTIQGVANSLSGDVWNLDNEF
ncbi:transferrin receptor protein 1-like [Erpetoichthys calabaricus]|uniref:transferrin receptor protein 1-like n=1 Tax=Erpetoichthys calabaricus TaxID=27687 RepID=UPI0022346D46|nr:transferrin receptor protein 1-like [Erpetoichthys calabaricus]